MTVSQKLRLATQKDQVNNFREYSAIVRSAWGMRIQCQLALQTSVKVSQPDGCTLHDLCPKDKQKLAKLLRQVRVRNSRASKCLWLVAVE